MTDKKPHSGQTLRRQMLLVGWLIAISLALIVVTGGLWLVALFLESVPAALETAIHASSLLLGITVGVLSVVNLYLLRQT